LTLSRQQRPIDIREQHQASEIIILIHILLSSVLLDSHIFRCRKSIYLLLQRHYITALLEKRKHLPPFLRRFYADITEDEFNESLPLLLSGEFSP